MIGLLTGRIVDDDVEGRVVLDVGGVGYEVLVPLGTLGRTGPRSGPVTLHVHTHVREDALVLFGFSSAVEKSVFRLLIDVPNVGPGLALRVLGAVTVAELQRAVDAGDVGALVRVKGIGKKTAELLVLQLQERLPRVAVPPGSEVASSTASKAARLVGALTNMGYRPAEAERAVASLGDALDEPLSDLLKRALASLAPRG